MVFSGWLFLIIAHQERRTSRSEPHAAILRVPCRLLQVLWCIFDSWRDEYACTEKASSPHWREKPWSWPLTRLYSPLALRLRLVLIIAHARITLRCSYFSKITSERIIQNKVKEKHKMGEFGFHFRIICVAIYIDNCKGSYRVEGWTNGKDSGQQSVWFTWASYFLLLLLNPWKIYVRFSCASWTFFLFL